jgi:hypothetical protein
MEDRFQGANGQDPTNVSQSKTENLKDNLRTLHRQLRQRSCQPKLVRQVESPKVNGTTRPMEISCTTDKLLYELTRRALEAAYELEICHSSMVSGRGGVITMLCIG